MKKTLWISLLAIIASVSVSIVGLAQQNSNNSAGNRVASASRSIGGVWEGHFQYDDPKRGTVKGDFTVSLTQLSESEFNGDITEPWSPGFPKGYSSFHSVVKSGVFDPASQRISFTKVYDYDGHAVYYVGKISDDGVLSGTWSIGSYTGTWRATLKKS